MTPMEFAQRCARIASRASAWAADVLDTNTGQPARREDVERFIREMRERLNYIEEKLNG